MSLGTMLMVWLAMTILLAQAALLALAAYALADWVF
jgi:hypothetical protein